MNCLSGPWANRKYLQTTLRPKISISKISIRKSVVSSVSGENARHLPSAPPAIIASK